MYILQRSRGILCLLLCLLCAAGNLQAQNISKAEYFFDTDLGVNNGTPISLPSGTDVTAAFQVPINSLSVGFHNLYTRAFVNPYTVNEGSGTVTKGGWSLTSWRAFYKENVSLTGSANVVRGEFFFDSDPGHGNGLNIPITAAPNITNIGFAADISGLADGFHLLYARFQDANGRWSLTTNRVLYKQNLSTDQNVTPLVVAGEFFIDNDPGIGSGHPVSLTPGTNITDLSFSVDISSVADGFHYLSSRFKNAAGQWSLTSTRIFYKEAIALNNAGTVVKMEQFIDTDPGFGNGKNVPFSPGQDVTVNFLADLTG